MPSLKLKELKIEDFSLDHTINSAQFFSYEKIKDFYYISLRNTVFKIKQEKNILYFQGIEESKLIEFFNLDENYEEHTKDFNDEYLIEAKKKYNGLRLMKIDLFQTIIGFICSANSNIHKIKINMKEISKSFGDKIEIDSNSLYSFPNPGEINNLDKLVQAKTGYRAKYILETNQIIKDNPKLLEKIENSNYLEAKELLQKFPGIGPKVADCICLFALNHKGSFPIDTWVKQLIENYYLKRKAKNLKEIEEFIQKNFKINGGVKQQYLFHYIRNLEK